MEEQPLSPLRPYKGSPELSNSTWYKGLLISLIAGTANNNGAFDIAIAKIRPGTEPPPHVHSREDEVFYLFSEEIRAYVGEEVLQVTAGECMFFPCFRSHVFHTISEELHLIAFLTPGGFNENTIFQMGFPAERMEIPDDADIETYANTDLTETINVFEQSGVSSRTTEEIHTQMPLYPR